MGARLASRLPLVLSALLLAVWVIVPTPASAGGSPFIRGDANADGDVNIADAIGLLNSLFVPNTPPLPCDDAADANDDGAKNIADAISILGFLFSAAGPLPEPTTSGFDPTPTDPFTCGDEPVVAGPGALVRIAAGQNSNAAAVEYVIRDQGEWDVFWSSHTTQGQNPPNVDFVSDIVIAAVRNYINIDHCVEIIAAAPNGSVSIRDFHSILPCAISFVPSSPFDIMLWEDAQVVPALTFGLQDVDACPLSCP